MTNSRSDKHWFALYTRPNHEFKARDQINSAGIECFLPEITRKKKWSDRVKTVVEPLIRGYIFICGDEKERLAALTSNAVINTVSFNGRPAVVPDWQIESLKKMLDQKGEILLSDAIPAGTLVKVVTWPLEGITGVVEEHHNSERFISISIEIINRTVSVKLPSDAVVKVVEH